MLDPLISIVTPSLNQGRFLPETLDSVLSQNYPSLDYIVMDGGSTDKSVELIRARETGISFWQSAPDFGWLNSDDLYLKQTLRTVADALAGCAKDPVVLYGGCEMFQDQTRRIELRPAVPFDQARLQITDFLDQPSVFFTRAAWERVGPLDQSLHYAFDWDWFLRATKSCRFFRCQQTLSRYRIHPSQKTGTGGINRWEEMSEVVRRYSSAIVARHYQYLLACPDARWWLNKRMRLAQIFDNRLPTKTAGAIATLCAPPFWILPRGISREILWEISGIRWD